jgi:hypothetical protein
VQRWCCPSCASPDPGSSGLLPVDPAAETFHVNKPLTASRPRVGHISLRFEARQALPISTGISRCSLVQRPASSVIDPHRNFSKHSSFQFQ